MTKPPIKEDKPLPLLFVIDPQELINNAETVSMKCTKQEELTVHYFLTVMPRDFNGKPLLEKSKTLLMCTNCGELRLVK